jgi:hypothetical protein
MACYWVQTVRAVTIEYHRSLPTERFQFQSQPLSRSCHFIKNRVLHPQLPHIALRGFKGLPRIFDRTVGPFDIFVVLGKLTRRSYQAQAQSSRNRPLNPDHAVPIYAHSAGESSCAVSRCLREMAHSGVACFDGCLHRHSARASFSCFNQARSMPWPLTGRQYDRSILPCSVNCASDIFTIAA